MKSMKIFTTTNSKQTQELGELLAEGIKDGKIICLEGELGSGKTTFAQGILKGLGAKGPYSSPTFVVLKEYLLKSKSQKLKAVYHMDAYRVTVKNVLDIGWKEIVADKNNIIIIEWADKIRKIIPKDSIWIKFKWLDKDKREIKLLPS